MAVPVLSPPTSPLGRVSTLQFHQILDELIVDTPPDLIWPLSNITFASMRRDAHLSAVLAGYSLQIRRATWQVDPAGCRPEVAQLVADDLGLPVMGVDRPTAARTRGVSWHEHLRSALLSMVYGHFGFELQADVSSGRARLAGLWERPPWSIYQIFADPISGQFTGINQAGQRDPRTITIPADRLAWYCRQREGVNWAGTSMLRAVFPQWLIKREMLRVAATSHRRFGMGVPVVEELPGANPSPQQHAEAARFAQSASVGEQSGGSLPPGFTLKLVGLTGSTPDTLAFLNFLNQEMSRAALMQHLDLGTTATGSRALGETFMDSWHLALETQAQELADVATRQIAARLVAWNWGPDEPVPAVVVSGIGSERQVTAQSLQLLMSAGALSADPGLEAWVRREYRLPERETPWTPPASKTATPSPGADTKPAEAPPAVPKPAAVLPGKRQARRPTAKASAGQLRLFASAGSSGDELQQQWEQAKAELLAEWPDTAQPMVDDLATQVQAAVDADDRSRLADLAVGVAVLAGLHAVLGGKATDVAVLARDGLVAEAAGAGHTVDPADPEPDVHAAAEVFTAAVAAAYVATASKAALVNFGDSAVDAARTAMDAMSAAQTGVVADTAGAVLSAGQNAGRTVVMQAAEADSLITGWTAEEVNDKNRCLPCSSIDGHTYSTLDAALADYPVIGFKSCAGGGRCRGRVNPVWK